mmetsp:Transcript_22311/g.65789  ORF Transcript_22311/g.65789 Transcript_22311/m.65789 type:complete len:358 (-) Transcript_22311:140-1213(-)
MQAAVAMRAAVEDGLAGGGGANPRRPGSISRSRSTWDMAKNALGWVAQHKLVFHGDEGRVGRDAVAAMEFSRRESTPLPMSAGVSTDAASAGTTSRKSSRQERARDVWVPAGFVSPEQLNDIATVWRRLDVDRSGALSTEELSDALGLLGFEGDKLAIATDLVQLVDEDGSGRIEWAEFRSLMVARVEDEARRAEEELLLEALDMNRDGTASAAELRALLTTTGDALTEREAADLVAMLSGTGGDDAGVITPESLHRGLTQICEAPGNRPRIVKRVGKAEKPAQPQRADRRKSLSRAGSLMLLHVRAQASIGGKRRGSGSSSRGDGAVTTADEGAERHATHATAGRGRGRSTAGSTS